MKVSVIVPTYNEKESILVLIRRIKKVFLKLKSKYEAELIVVDDNSPDKTGKIIQKVYKSDPSIRESLEIRRKLSTASVACFLVNELFCL